MSGISRDEWLAALGEAEPQDDPTAITVAELAEMLDIHEGGARERLRRLVSEQKAVQTMKLVRRSDGQRLRIPAYRLLK